MIEAEAGGLLEFVQSASISPWWPATSPPRRSCTTRPGHPRGRTDVSHGYVIAVRWAPQDVSDHLFRGEIGIPAVTLKNFAACAGPDEGNLERILNLLKAMCPSPSSWTKPTRSSAIAPVRRQRRLQPRVRADRAVHGNTEMRGKVIWSC